MIPPWWKSKDPWVIGDVIEQLKLLPDGVVHCVVTSPPYWGLRDYGTGKWEGGNPDCTHEEAKVKGRADYGFSENCEVQQGNPSAGFTKYKSVCPTCGAKRLDVQIGLEQTPAEYVAKMVEVFAEVKRVLRPDGTLWLNLGDSYCSSPAGNITPSGFSQKGGKREGNLQAYNTQPKSFGGLKAKDLVGIPWAVAFALRDVGGWYLRSDIIWNKPNPMPESIEDRPTKSHEYIFLLTKSAKYFYDHEAIREPLSESTKNDPRIEDMGRTYEGKGRQAYGELGPANGQMQAWSLNPAGRNKRTVWTITTKPFAGAHFATFPTELPELCIKAGTSEKGCCPKCGKPWVRHYDTIKEDDRTTATDARKSGEAQREHNLTHGGLDMPRSTKPDGSVYPRIKSGLTWVADCECGDHQPIPCIVLDIFGGSGTTALVAQELGRQGLLIELNPEYEKLIKGRLRKGCETLDSFGTVEVDVVDMEWGEALRKLGGD